jgi:hypothetical protein
MYSGNIGEVRRSPQSTVCIAIRRRPDCQFARAVCKAGSGSSEKASVSENDGVGIISSRTQPRSEKNTRFESQTSGRSTASESCYSFPPVTCSLSIEGGT